MQQLHHWHHTKIGLLIFAVVELGIAYDFASLSIDRGNLWWYLLTLAFLMGSLKNIFALISKVLHVDKR